MTLQIAKAERLFTFNGVSLPDPGPHMTPEQVKDLYAASYPELTSAVVEGPEMKGGKMIYTYRRAVGTKA